MHKRGQIYLLVALIMSVIIFGMVTVSNRVEQANLKSSFEDLSENYAVESAKMINSLIGQDNIVESFRNFTLLFTSYSKTQNPMYELIYAIDYNNTLLIGNYLKHRLFVCTDENCDTFYSPLEGCYSNIPAAIVFDGLELPVEISRASTEQGCEIAIDSENLEKIYITINEITYPFTIRKGSPGLIIVSWESKAEQRKVFTEGDFIKTHIPGPLMTMESYCQKSSECDNRYCECPSRKVLCPRLTEDECKINSNDCAWNKQIEKCVEKSQ